jgi:hypothetical protein
MAVGQLNTKILYLSVVLHLTAEGRWFYSRGDEKINQNITLHLSLLAARPYLFMAHVQSS